MRASNASSSDFPFEMVFKRDGQRMDYEIELSNFRTRVRERRADWI